MAWQSSKLTLECYVVMEGLLASAKSHKHEVKDYSISLSARTVLTWTNDGSLKYYVALVTAVL
jgi:hypothetical protein